MNTFEVLETLNWRGRLKGLLKKKRRSVDWFVSEWNRHRPGSYGETPHSTVL
ncbi:hypothetical protein MM239_11320 [Belliella sp. DSM 111904]|uniref:Uncharacterized protein n=1 Tax=Belliella filtrata TaxID=2923435 RepID=A0ABS9V0P5_9BACT|nr:hypothetical protein [Belliella filtrata]MCH7409985.1 hypothetical protein [Belliella filtrata]